jgi:hypothetical protein
MFGMGFGGIAELNVIKLFTLRALFDFINRLSELGFYMLYYGFIFGG